MKWMHAAVVGCLVVGLAGCGNTGKSTKETSKSDTSTVHKETVPPGGDAGKEGSNKDKIVGTWKIVKGEDAPPGATTEFTKDGKMKLSAKVEGKDFNMEGTYSVEGDKLTTTMKDPMGKEQKETSTITKLTDKEMVVKDEKGKTAEFEKK